MSPSDIKFYHSGGGSNCDGLLDLGGQRSSCELTSGATLFDKISPKKSRGSGPDIPGWKPYVDYRCFYVKNTHADETLRNAKFYIDWERKSGSFIDVGVKRETEIQQVEISGGQANEGDSMTLNLATYGDWTVDYHVNITAWQGRFQTSMRGMEGLQDVIIEAAGTVGSSTNVVFTVNFVGRAKNHKLPTMTVVDNSLTNLNINIMETKDGSPINVVACIIPKVTQAPACVQFNDYFLRGNPIELGDMRPGEEFPVWVRRTTPKNTRIGILDKVRFQVDGTFP